MATGMIVSKGIDSTGKGMARSGSAGISRSKLAENIRELRLLLSEGILEKNEFKEHVKALIASSTKDNQQQQVHQHVVVNNSPAATAALESKRQFRNGKSPETLMIRRIIEGPITRRLLCVYNTIYLR